MKLNEAAKQVLLNEEDGPETLPIKPNVKSKMIQRLNDAINMVKKANTLEGLSSLDGSEYDIEKGTFSVMIYSKRTDG